MTPASPSLLSAGPRRRAALFATCLLCAATAASAQDSGVTVNPDILNNLDWAAAVAARGGFAPGGGADLLPPPADFPESRLLIRPKRIARKTALAATPPPPRKPTEVAGYEPTPAELGSEDPGVVAAQALAAAEASAQAAPEPPPPPAAAVEAPAPPEPPAPEPPAPEPPAKVIAALPPPEPPAPEPLASGPPPKQQRAAEPPADPAGETRSAVLAAPLAPLERVRLRFESGSAALAEEGRAKLEALARTLLAEPARRIEVRAYAAGGGEARPSDIRRLSLSRALAVRSFLTDKGVAATRIDLRPLGEKAGSGPADRADIVDASG